MLTNLKVFEMTSIAGQKKSSALTARAVNRMTSQTRYITSPSGNKVWPNVQYSTLTTNIVK